MPVELLWLPQAKADLLDIYGVIGLENPSAAERVFDALEVRARQLYQSPLIVTDQGRFYVPSDAGRCHPAGWYYPYIHCSGPAARIFAPECGSSWRGRTSLLYEALPDADDGVVEQVVIVRVIDGRRNLARVL